MKKNKGYSLVELLVAVAIFSIVFASVTALMVTGSNSFAKGNADAEMQRQAQLVVDQIEDMIIDTNGGVDFVVSTDRKELVLYNQIVDGAGTTTYTKELVTWEKATEEITYSKYNVAYDNATKTFVVDSSVCENELLAEKVREFDVDVSDTVEEYNEEGEQVKIVQSVKIMAEYIADSGAVAYATTPVITLRNRMMLAGNPKMVFEEPPYVPPVPDKELGVEVEVLGFTKTAGHWGFDEDGAGIWIEAFLTVKCRGKVTQSGFEDDELEYQWSASIPVSFPNGNANPNECEIKIEKPEWDLYAGKTIDITLTATPNVEYADGPQSGTAPFRVPTASEGDSYHERGRSHGEDYYAIDNVKNGNAVSYKIFVYDGTGTLYENQDELKEYIKIEQLEAGGFKFNIQEGLDPSMEYYVKVIVHTDKNIDVEKELYIPAVQIVGKVSRCPWNDWDTGKTFGWNDVGEGVQYTVSGYYLGSWSANQPYDIEIIDWKCTVDSTIPTGMQIQFIKKQDTSVADKANRFRLAFLLDAVHEDGTPLTADEKKDVQLTSLRVKITMHEFSNVFGYATVYFD